MTDVSDMPTKEDAARAIRAALRTLNGAIRTASFYGVRTEMKIEKADDGIEFIDGEAWKRA
jgi:hypothetical protein